MATPLTLGLLFSHLERPAFPIVVKNHDPLETDPKVAKHLEDRYLCSPELSLIIEVVGFLPKSFGDTVVVPSEIVGKAGSDYDIDKLSIYFPNSYRDGDTLKRVKFDENKTIKQQSKKALQNELQNIIRDVLSHPASFDQLITPVGASTLKDEAKVSL